MQSILGELEHVIPRLENVRRSRRYTLLCLMLLHSKDLACDIETDESLRKLKVAQWPLFIFQTLQNDHTIDLLQRLINLKPECTFLEVRGGQAAFSHSPCSGARHGDPHQLLVYLKLSDLDLAQVNEQIESMKRKSATSKD